MTTRRTLTIAAAAMLLLAAAPAEDPDIRANPAIARIARTDTAGAASLLEAARRALREPKPPQPKSMAMLENVDRTLVTENPIMKQLFTHDPTAALGLLERIKAAGGSKR